MSTTNEHTNNLNMASSIVLCLGFLGAICIPALAGFFGWSIYPPLKERRTMTEMPASPKSADDFRAYPGDFERFYSDNFGFRNEFVRWHSAVIFTVFNMSPMPGVVVGQENRYFRGGDFAEPYMYREPFDDATLQGWITLLNARRNLAKEHGAKFVFGVVPEAFTIYSDYLPQPYRDRASLKARIDTLGEAISAELDMDLLDMRPTIMAARESGVGDLYHRLDSHWDALGAYFGYAAIAEFLHEKHGFPPTIPFESFAFTERIEKGGVLNDLLALPWDYYEYVPKAEHRDYTASIAVDSAPFSSQSWAYHTTAPVADTGKILFVTDSFGNRIRTYLASHFSDLALYTVPPQSEITNEKLEAIVEKERPDVIVWLVSERWLVRMEPESLLQ